MANFPCPERVIDCDCADSQIVRNYSSENPDNFTFFALTFYQGRPRLNAPPNNFVTPNGPGVCYSPVSQQAANDCSLHNAQDRVWTPWAPPNTRYGNAAQTCFTACPSGPASSYTVPANTFFSNFSQAEADALALSYCSSRGFLLRECPPIAVTLDPPFVGESSAVLLGSVNPNNEDTIAYFEWGTTTAYGNTTDAQFISADVSSVEINALITGLVPGTYHYRIVAFNSMGFAEGLDKTFTIESSCPIPWGELGWTSGVTQEGDPAGSSLIGVSGGTIDMEATVPQQNGGNSQIIEAHGTVNYTGPSSGASLHIEVSGAAGGMGVTFNISVDGNPVFVSADHGGDFTTDGVYDYVFSIPTSVGAVITVDLVMNIGNNVELSSLAWNATLACDCGEAVHQIDDYDETIAAAISALSDNPAPDPSDLPPWDGAFRDAGDGTFTSRPECFSIDGKGIALTLTPGGLRPTFKTCTDQWFASTGDCVGCGGGQILSSTTVASNRITISGSGNALYNDAGIDGGYQESLLPGCGFFVGPWETQHGPGFANTSNPIPVPRAAVMFTLSAV